MSDSNDFDAWAFCCARPTCSSNDVDANACPLVYTDVCQTRFAWSTVVIIHTYTSWVVRPADCGGLLSLLEYLKFAGSGAPRYRCRHRPVASCGSTWHTCRWPVWRHRSGAQRSASTRQRGSKRFFRAFRISSRRLRPAGFLFSRDAVSLHRASSCRRRTRNQHHRLALFSSEAPQSLGATRAKEIPTDTGTRPTP